MTSKKSPNVHKSGPKMKLIDTFNNCLKKWVKWAKMLQQALQSCPKCNKSHNLVILLSPTSETRNMCQTFTTWTGRGWRQASLSARRQMAKNAKTRPIAFTRTTHEAPFTRDDNATLYLNRTVKYKNKKSSMLLHFGELKTIIHYLCLKCKISISCLHDQWE